MSPCRLGGPLFGSDDHKIVSSQQWDFLCWWDVIFTLSRALESAIPVIRTESCDVHYFLYVHLSLMLPNKFLSSEFWVILVDVTHYVILCNGLCCKKVYVYAAAHIGYINTYLMSSHMDEIILFYGFTKISNLNFSTCLCYSNTNAEQHGNFQTFSKRQGIISHGDYNHPVGNHLDSIQRVRSSNLSLIASWKLSDRASWNTLKTYKREKTISRWNMIVPSI